MAKAKRLILETGKQVGFTLLELMVVVALIGLISATVVVTLPATQARPSAYTSLLQLQRQLQTASQRATREQRWYGLRFDGQRYHFMRFAKGQWTNASQAGSVTLPDDVLATLSTANLHGDNEQPEPQVQLSPEGLFTPFRLVFSQHNQQAVLSDPYGEIE